MLPNFQQYLKEKSDLSDTYILQLVRDAKVKEFQKGEFLLKAGEVCKHAMFTESGLLRTYTVDGSAKEHIIQFAPETWLTLDRASIYFSEPSDFYIDAIETSRVVLLTTDFILKISRIDPKFQLANDRALHNHIRQLQQRINQLLGATAEERYLAFIQKYPDLLLRVPQWMIASYLGITPESLSRVRKELARKNFK